MSDPQQAPGFGANSWLVEEMYEQFRADPDSVAEAWQEFFEDYKPAHRFGDTETASSAPAADGNGAATRGDQGSGDAGGRQAGGADRASAAHPGTGRESRTPAADERAAAPAMPTTPAPAAPAPAVPAPAAEPPGDPIKGAGKVIVTNMERSLTVPTATSFRNVPAKLLEINRKVINGYRTRSGATKVSFTHLIGYAIVRAIVDAVPNMNNTYVEGTDGTPRIIRNEHVNMSLAVDVEKRNGTRTLLVPVVRNADTYDFAGFLAEYEEIIRKVRNNKLSPDDFAGATISLTNPGTIGTVQSVPRLMPGQGVIVGVGNIDYPAEFEGTDRVNLSRLGVSKVVTITSTYDHRIIQGAESGLFLKYVHELLLGEHGFYEDVFRSLDMPYEAVKWRPDVNPIDREAAMLDKQMRVSTLIRVYRCAATSSPISIRSTGKSRRCRSSSIRQPTG